MPWRWRLSKHLAQDAARHAVLPSCGSLRMVRRRHRLKPTPGHISVHYSSVCSKQHMSRIQTQQDDGCVRLPAAQCCNPAKRLTKVPRRINVVSWFDKSTETDQNDRTTKKASFLCTVPAWGVVQELLRRSSLV